MAITISDVAKYAGVGVGTVSRVLNGSKSVNEDTKQTVLRAIDKLGYSPNSMAKRLRKQKNGVIALMIPVIYHPFFALFADSAEKEAAKYGYSLMLVASQQHVERENEIIGRMISKEVDGAIFVTHYVHSPEEYKNCRIVSVDRNLGDKIPVITSDNYDATCVAVEYMLERGCKRIGYVGTRPLVPSDVLLREKAYRDVMEKYGLEPLVFNFAALHGGETKLVNDFLDAYPDMDGAFASGYTTAQRLYEAVTARGKKIPVDFQIVSYDGNFELWEDKKMTCVEQPVAEMAQKAVQVLMSKINDGEAPDRVVLKTSFVVGTTTK